MDIQTVDPACVDYPDMIRFPVSRYKQRQAGPCHVQVAGVDAGNMPACLFFVHVSPCGSMAEYKIINPRKTDNETAYNLYHG